MDKNENGSTAQFSPEELIRRLKSQLNISAEDTSANLSDAPELEVEEITLDEINEDPTEVEPEIEEVLEEETVFAEDETEEEVLEDSSDDSNDAVAENAEDTFEFSVSNLFSDCVKENDSVAEITEDEIDNTEKADDSDNGELDFMKFLAGSGISVNEVKDENVVEDDSQLVFDVAEDEDELQLTSPADAFGEDVDALEAYVKTDDGKSKFEDLTQDGKYPIYKYFIIDDITLNKLLEHMSNLKVVKYSKAKDFYEDIINKEQSLYYMMADRGIKDAVNGVTSAKNYGFDSIDKITPGPRTGASKPPYYTDDDDDKDVINEILAQNYFSSRRVQKGKK
jgi:hypothetical protein